MQGTIRVILGLVVLMGVAGGIDNATDAELFILESIRYSRWSTHGIRC